MPSCTPSTSLLENLRFLLDEWDPIGVAELSQDEYDCMLAPLVERLQGGADRAEIGEFRWHELEDHFGLDPAFHGTDAMADRLVLWWTALHPAQGAAGHR